jgi:hypothetical protein
MGELGYLAKNEKVYEEGKAVANHVLPVSSAMFSFSIRRAVTAQ